MAGNQPPFTSQSKLRCISVLGSDNFETPVRGAKRDTQTGKQNLACQLSRIRASRAYNPCSSYVTQMGCPLYSFAINEKPRRWSNKYQDNCWGKISTSVLYGRTNSVHRNPWNFNGSCQALQLHCHHWCDRCSRSFLVQCVSIPPR